MYVFVVMNTNIDVIDARNIHMALGLCLFLPLLANTNAISIYRIVLAHMNRLFDKHFMVDGFRYMTDFTSIYWHPFTIADSCSTLYNTVSHSYHSLHSAIQYEILASIHLNSKVFWNVSTKSALYSFVLRLFWVFPSKVTKKMNKY